MNTIRVPLKTIAERLELQGAAITTEIYRTPICRAIEAKIEDDCWAIITIRDHNCSIGYYSREHREWQFDDTDGAGYAEDQFNVDDMTISEVIKQIIHCVNHRRPDHD